MQEVWLRQAAQLQQCLLVMLTGVKTLKDTFACNFSHLKQPVSTGPRATQIHYAGDAVIEAVSTAERKANDKVSCGMQSV